MDRRIKLSKNVQTRLIHKLSNLKGSLKEASIFLDLPYSTLKNYSSGSIYLPEGLFLRILDILEVPSNSLVFEYLEPNWGRKLGAKKAMRVLEKKYPKKLKKWRSENLRKNRFDNLKKIKEPDLCESLAELVGIYLGDGTMTKNLIRISGDVRVDKPYFDYISNLVKSLFGISPAVRSERGRNTLLLTVQSRKLVSYFMDEFGLKPGNKIKNQSKIPEDILSNNSMRNSCLRGLIDTDGSVSRRGRNGSQFCLQFTSHNPFLLKQVIEIGKGIGVFTFVDKKNGAGTNSWENIRKYFSIVGSSNLRHIVRFNERLNGNTLYQKQVSRYYQKGFYKGLNLPFKLRAL